MFHGKLVRWEGGKIRREQIEESQRKKGAYLRAREQRLDSDVRETENRKFSKKSLTK